jgi:hypothetical protein
MTANHLQEFRHQIKSTTSFKIPNHRPNRMRGIYQNRNCQLLSETLCCICVGTPALLFLPVRRAKLPEYPNGVRLDELAMEECV